MSSRVGGLETAAGLDTDWDVLLEGMISSMSDGVSVVDAHGNFVLANEAALSALGISNLNHPVNRHVMNLFRPDGSDFPMDERPASRALRGETVTAEHVVHRGASGDRTLVVSASPVSPDPNTGVARCVCVFHDATEELAARNDLASFARVVAHDLQNPLSAVGGWARMAQVEMEDKGALSHELATEMVTRVSSAVDRMSVMIDDLLTHAVSRDRDLKVEEVNLAVEISSIADAHEASEFISWSDLLPVRADRILLRHALDNVLSNALKFVGPNVRPEIHVSGRMDDTWVSITIADNGVGIEDGHHGLVFKEFHRERPAEYPGTGLGLAIVKRVAERHGGTASIRANPKHSGSLVELRFPQ